MVNFPETGGFSTALFANTTDVMMSYSYTQSLVRNHSIKTMKDYMNDLPKEEAKQLESDIETMRIMADRLNTKVNDWVEQQDREYQRNIMRNRGN
jgi:hypothetical protein